MNYQERMLLRQMAEEIKTPSVQTADVVDGKLTTEEAARRLHSEDYKLGWRACRERVDEYIAEFQRKASARGGRR